MHPSFQPTFLSSQGDSMMIEVLRLPMLYLDYFWLIDNLLYFFLGNHRDFSIGGKCWGASASPFWVVRLCKSGKAHWTGFLPLHGNPTAGMQASLGSMVEKVTLTCVPRYRHSCHPRVTLCASAFPAGFSQLCLRLWLCLLWFNLWLKLHGLQLSGRKTSSPVLCW